MVARLAQTHVEPEHWSVDIDAIVEQRRLGQVPVRDVHVNQTAEKRTLIIDVIAHTRAQGTRPLKQKTGFYACLGAEVERNLVV